MTPLKYTLYKLLYNSTHKLHPEELEKYERHTAQSVQYYIEKTQKLYPPFLPIKEDVYDGFLEERIKEYSKDGDRVLKENKILLQNAHELWFARRRFASVQRQYFQITINPFYYYDYIKRGLNYYIKMIKNFPVLQFNKIGIPLTNVKTGSPAFWLIWLILLIIFFGYGQKFIY